MRKRDRIRISVVIGFLLLSALMHPRSIFADSVTDTVSVYVGYFGWTDDQYVEKATYHWSDLDDQFGGSLNTKTAVYSYYSGKRTYLAAARGFTVRDLLEHAGIDMSSISRIDFFTKDQTVGPYRSFTKYSLLDVPRYYFPNLAAEEETGNLYAWNGNNIWDGATRVESMLALEDYTEWDAVGTEFEKFYDSTMLSPSSRFHLFFGQADPKEANTSSAAKYVYKIFVTFSGTPVLSTDQTNIDLKVGSDFTVNVDSEAEDGLLDQYVAQHLEWSSSDESVAEVDSSGKLTAKKTGVTMITATFGKSSVSIPVKVGGNGSGSGGGNGSVSGSSGTGVSDPKDEGQGTTQDVQQAVAGEPAKNLENSDADKAGKGEPSEQKETVYELSTTLMSQKDYANWVQHVLKNTKTPEEHISKQAQKSNIGMSADAEQLVVLTKEQPKLLAALSGILAVFFLAGFAYGILRFKKGFIK
jgi:hypothetical protein